MDFWRQWAEACMRRQSECGHLGAVCNIRKTFAEHEAELRTFCKTKPDVEIAKVSPPVQEKASSQKTAAQNAAMPKSASCSDITGTNSTTPAAGDCKDANTFLHSARVIRKKYGLLAQEQYKQAAKSYRLAGDTAKADAALREAALSDQAFDAEQNATAMNQPNPVREALLRSADTMLKSARDIDGRPATCSEFRDAAAFYFQAGKFLFDAGDAQKADQLFLRRDFLNNEVDRMEQEGRCHAQVTLTPAFTSSDKCKPVAEAVKYLRRIDRDLASLNSLSAPDCNIAEIKRAIFHECIRIYMNDEMDASERVRQANEFGCPLAKR
jgi:tetratricopeptide (TPR) repeat protein